MVHVLLEILSGIICTIPLAAVCLGWWRTRSPRLAMAAVAFAVLEARLFGMVLIHTLVQVDHTVEELLDWGGDLAVIMAFATAFLYGTRWFPERRTPEPARAAPAPPHA
jgi:hypothetical protein